MTAPELEILSLGPDAPAADLRAWLAGELRERFPFRRIAHGALPLDDAWIEPPSPGHGEDGAPPRLSSNRVVDALIDRAHATGTSHTERWTLALTGLDLATPSRDFVFGEAALGGGWAVVSTARLGGGPRGPSHLRRRLLAEALHELGHLAGLPHCDRDACVMRPAVLPADIDARQADFCGRCAALLAADRP